MSDSSSWGVEVIPPERARQFEDVCNRFEAAWKTGPLPRIEDFLEAWAGVERLVLLRELIALDSDYRRRGQLCAPANYGACFPEFEPHWLHESSGVAPAPTRPYYAAAPGANSPSGLQSLDDYDMLEEMARGGMGVVYRARQRSLNRIVALKLILAGPLASPEMVSCFRTEAEIVANLDHPHIVPVYSVGSTEDCPCFIVSKFIEGCTLAEKIKDDRPTVGDTAELVAIVAEALHYAHRQGLVHRDVKPGNIMLDTSGKPFVVDFGLALKEENLGHGPKYGGVPGSLHKP